MSNVLTFSVSADSTRQLMRNLYVLPRAVAKRQLLKALNAAGGVAKTAALARVGVQSGLLKKSLVVKVIKDKKTKDYIGVMVGPSRKVSGYVRDGKKIGLKRAGKLIAAFKEAAQIPAGKLTKANLKSLDQGVDIAFRRPSRYAHLSERKHPAIAAADSALRNAGYIKLREKVAQGIEEERAKLPVK